MSPLTALSEDIERVVRETSPSVRGTERVELHVTPRAERRVA